LGEDHPLEKQTAPIQKLEKFFSMYCADCHSGGAEEGGLSLDQLGHDLSDVATFARWERIFDRVESGEMPPNDYETVKPEHQTAFKQILGKPLFDAHFAAKGTVFRRLNRQEYQNTLNDLFGTNIELAKMLPEDGRSHEFDTVGQSLSVSSVQMQLYLDAIDRVLTTAILDSDKPVEATTRRASYSEVREKSHIGKAWGQAEDGAVVFYRRIGYPSGMLRDANARHAGRYKIRVTGYAYQTDQPVTFSIGATSFERASEKPTFAYQSFPPGKPTTIEIEAWMEDRYMVEITPWGISDPDNLIRKHGIDKYQGPGLAINHVEIEGPLVDSYPLPGHRLLFAGLDRKEIEPRNSRDKTRSWYVPKFKIASDHPKKDAAKVLSRVAEVAFRRPVKRNEIDPYLDLFQSEIDYGEEFEPALKTAVAAIFCSPDFLYMAEPEGWLDDYALANRLSYFLVRTAPDAELLAAAKAGKLTTDPLELLDQAHRLMEDPRHERFLVDFTNAWLNLREIEFTNPDDKLFPEFDPFLQDSMVQETRAFFHLLVKENASVRNLVKSDFATLNRRLAELYEIDGVEGPEIRKVSLPKDSPRGGLLSQGSILKVSANGTNTSPVVRGVWVLERILGTHVPPPPPGIPGVEPDIRGATTLREILEKHRNVESCNSCHQKIDPPGFALECFNPIGGYREKFRSLGEGERIDKRVNGQRVRYRIGQPVDASGQLEDGTQFDNFIQFRNLLASNDDQLARTLATKFLVFATGREMGFSDRPAIDAIVKKSKEKGHGVRDLIDLVITSSLFRQK